MNNTSLNNCCFLSFMSTDAQQQVSIYLLCYVCSSITWSCCLGSTLFHFFFALLLSRVTRTSRSLRACLHLTQKRWKLPVLQIQASSMKLRAHAFLFLVFLRIKWVVKTNFYYNDFNIQIRRFLTELVESKSRGNIAR